MIFVRRRPGSAIKHVILQDRDVRTRQRMSTFSFMGSRVDLAQERGGTRGRELEKGRWRMEWKEREKRKRGWHSEE